MMASDLYKSLPQAPKNTKKIQKNAQRLSCSNMFNKFMALKPLIFKA